MLAARARRTPEHSGWFMVTGARHVETSSLEDPERGRGQRLGRRQDVDSVLLFPLAAGRRRDPGGLRGRGITAGQASESLVRVEFWGPPANFQSQQVWVPGTRIPNQFQLVGKLLAQGPPA